MRDRTCRHEMFLKPRRDRGFDFVDVLHGFFDRVARRHTAQGNPGAGACGIAGRSDLVQRRIRDHPQNHRVFRADMRAKCPGQRDLFHGFHAHLIHQQPGARVERGLRQLNGANVALRHGDHRATIGAAIVQQVGMRATLGNHPRRARLIGTADQAALIDQTGHAHFCHGFDDPRPANPGDAAGCGCVGKARLGRPQVRSDHFESGFLADRVDLHPLDRSGCGALPR